MNALIPVEAPPIEAGSLVPFTAEERESVRRYAGRAKAPGTVLAYRKDYQAFVDWCAAHGLCPMPATTETVILFIIAQADDGLAASSIGRRLAGIAYSHRLGRYANPCTGDELKEVLAGIRRTIGTAPKRKAAATADILAAMLKLCPPTLAGHRDRALLALGFAGAFRRSELVALKVADLIEVPDGLRVRIRRSKTDQDGAGAEIAIPRGYRLRPVEAVQTWLAAAALTEGPLFRPVMKGGRIQPEQLSGFSVAQIVKRYAERAGLDPAAYAGHSLRAGLITSAAEAGAAIHKIQEISRHKSVQVLSAYVRSADLFKEHAGAAFL
jgi:site-specific recombinase XerD